MSGQKKGAAKTRRAKSQPKATPPPGAEDLSADDLDKLTDLLSPLNGNTPSALPPLPDDVDPDAAWVRASGWSPLEYLTHCYRNPWMKTSDRVAAARAVLDYAHKRMPQRLALGGDPANPIIPSFSPAALSALTDIEVDQLRALLDKLGGFK